MNVINNLIEKINFKKLIVAYIIIGLIVAIGLILFIGDKFQSKLEFVFNYHKISNKFEESNMNLDEIKNSLKNLSEKSEDIVDCLILDKENNILYSSKESEFGKKQKFVLSKNSNCNRYLTDLNNSTIFKVVNKDILMLSTIISNFNQKIENDYNDEIFFESNFNNKKVYLLSYTANKDTGEKIYFISEIQPVKNGKMYIKMALAIAMFFFMIYWILVALYIYQNALKSKLNPYLWGGITLITNIAGVIIYFIYKQNNKVCFKCRGVQSKNSIFCVYCGTKLNDTCKNCDNILNEHDKYCSRCGTKNK